MVLLLWWLLAPAARAQQAEPGQEPGSIEDEFQLLQEEISVHEVASASKHRQPIAWSPSAVTVFTKQDIRASGATCLVDLLRRVPGFDVYEVKPSGPLVGARSFTNESNNLVLLLVDGREAMVEMTGFAVWSALTFDLEQVERMEVIRGPGSTLYGANAFAAVVSVTTVADRPATGAELQLSGGELDWLHLFAQAHGTFDLAGGILTFGVGLGSEERTSVSDPADLLDIVRLRSHGTVRFRMGKDLDLSLHAGVVQGEGMLHLVGDLRGEGVLNEHLMAQVESELGTGLHLKAQLYHNFYQGDFYYRNRLSAYGVWVADFPRFAADNHTIDGQVQLDVSLIEGLLLTAGGNLRYTLLNADHIVPSRIDELRGAGFIHAEWHPLDWFQLTGGLRLDLSQTFDPTFSPRVVAMVSPWEGHVLRLGYGLAFRKPSLFEGRLHPLMDNYNPAFPEVPAHLAEQVGNENLKNEEVHSVELGWRSDLLHGQLSVALDLFYNIYIDTIGFSASIPLRLNLPDVAHAVFQFVNNPDRLQAFGGEAEVRIRPGGVWNAWANVAVRHVANLDTGKVLESEPTLRVNFGGSYTPPEGVIADLALHYVSSYSIGSMDPANPFQNFVPTPLGNAWVLVARLGYRFGLGALHGCEAGLTARTPLGADFREYPGVPMTPQISSDTLADFGGERLGQLVALYLRAAY